MNNICRNGLDEAEKEKVIAKFLELMKDESVDLIPHQAKSLEIASKLKEKDTNLDTTDLLIVSQALIDKYSTILLTNDGRLIDSPEIDKLKKSDDRLRKLKISESL